MAKQLGIWIDTQKAVFVKLGKDGATIKEIESDIETKSNPGREGDKGSFWGGQHSNNEKKFFERKKNSTDKFFKKVSGKIGKNDEVVVFGTGNTPGKFAAWHNNNLPEKGVVLDAKRSAKITRNQLVAKIRKYFDN